jgi:2-polyprenyl-6-hydroxyphenyl methylase/3-demethylubiquinone-9 3-methyltransferase
MSATRAEFPANAVTYHASLADGWERRCQKRSFRMRQSVLLKCLQGRDLAGTVWLDAGCGTGTLARWLAARGCSVLGVDAAAEMVAAAAVTVKAQNCSDRLSFVQIDTIARLALDDNLLDGILCSSVLEYVPDPGACLTEFARVLKPGGLLLVSIPNRNSVVRRAQFACHQMGGLLGQKWASFLDHSRHQYSRHEFERLLMHAGLLGEKLVPFGGPLPRLAQRSCHWAPLLMFVAQKSA